MSAVAGNRTLTIGSYYLAKFNHGKGMQLGTALGRRYGEVVIIGDGVVGRHAAKAAHGMGTMPGAYPRTSTMALTAATLPYVMQLARKGVEALRQDHSFAKGVNTHNGYITRKPVPRPSD
jgi:alanine dehydrogenase